MVIRFLIRSSARKAKHKEVPVYVRVRDDVIDSWQRTSILVDPEKWDSKEEKIRSRVVMNEQDRADFNNSISNLRVFITKKYADASQTQRMREDWLTSVIKLYAKMKSSPAPRERKKDIGDLFDRFLENRDCAESRKKQYRVVKRVLQRYELFVRETRQKNYQLDVKRVDADTLYDLWNFMENENLWYETYPEIYEKFPNTKKVPQARGRNTIVGCFKRLRAFFAWCEDRKLIERSPFKDIKIPEEVYGDPIFITKEEMLALYRADLSEFPDLGAQRDVFIFQCCVGCRVSDLIGKKRSDIVDGAFQYMPSKTLDREAKTVVVPLNTIAKAILDKYTGLGDDILPFIPSQEYNEKIREVFTKVGLTRIVSWRNPLSGKEEKRPINEIASSHMARRTFIGNLYKELKDPNLIGSMSGHVEGSRAFSRYRNIDREIKNNVVKLLEQ